MSGLRPTETSSTTKARRRRGSWPRPGGGAEPPRCGAVETLFGGQASPGAGEPLLQTFRPGLKKPTGKQKKTPILLNKKQTKKQGKQKKQRREGGREGTDMFSKQHFKGSNKHLQLLSLWGGRRASVVSDGCKSSQATVPTRANHSLT